MMIIAAKNLRVCHDSLDPCENYYNKKIQV